MNNHILFVKNNCCILTLAKYNIQKWDYDPDYGNVTDAHHLTFRECLDTGRLIIRGNKKLSDYETIPLLKKYHQGSEGIHTLGAKEWIKKHGFTQEQLYYIFCKINNLEYIKPK
jgi:hypothetical protein